jgi:hypothetical protein
MIKIMIMRRVTSKFNKSAKQQQQQHHHHQTFFVSDRIGVLGASGLRCEESSV